MYAHACEEEAEADEEKERGEGKKKLRKYVEIVCNQHKNDITLARGKKPEPVYVMCEIFKWNHFWQILSEDVLRPPSLPLPLSTVYPLGHTLVTKRKVIKIAFNATAREREGEM